MIQIFVFGTLKKGFPNFESNKGTRIDGDFVTKERYPLYLVGQRCSPWLIDNPGSGEFVRGQVFLVDSTALAIMDKLERITEPDGYDRIEMVVRNIMSEEELVVFVYMKRLDLLNPDEIALGALKCYELEHANRYVSRYE